MFTLTEVASLNNIQPTYRILKPWWDVFMDYFGFVMLMLAIFAGSMQISRDNVACLPILEESTKTSNTNSYLTPSPVKTSPSSPFGTVPEATQDLPDSVAHKIGVSAEPQPKGRKTNLDYQQYLFVNQMCYHTTLPWYSKYFPYLVLIHTIMLMVSSNFWFKYPKTCSKIEHFVSILGRCFESPWTTKALSETACEDSEEKKQRLIAGQSGAKQPSSVSQEEENSSHPLLGSNPLRFSPVGTTSLTILDKKDGEQAKALFEKVRTFRAHVEDSDFIYKLYVVQTMIKMIKLIFTLCYTSTFAADISFSYICEPELKHLTGYERFSCTHNMAFMLRKLIFTFMTIIGFYSLMCSYALFWLFRGPLKEYSFEKVREESSFSDIPDVKNDFAFLLHMVDQYDQLHSKRFGIFLSEVSENKLREISLNHEWTLEKLRQHVTSNAQNKQELHLVKLSGLPQAVFDLTELEVLKIELIPEVQISAKISQMTNLQELHLYNCPAKVEQTSFTFLRDHLRCLHVKFTDVTEIPPWVYLLKSLRELYLIGDLYSENNKMIGLESLKELRHLKILHFKSNLNKIPTSLTDLSTHLVKLVVYNDGTKLQALHGLKKLMSLRELELHHCDLERIPNALVSLTNLQDLDLKSNNFETIEEVISFQHLKRLTCLKLWHNKIISVPPTINQVKNLESVYLSYNKLETLPPAMFNLPKLRYLDLGYNSISLIPVEVGFLQNLQHFDITGNKVEDLPKQLFRCTKLKVLCVGKNSITVLPEAIGQLTQLVQLDVKGNYLDLLPFQLCKCRRLNKSSFNVEDHLFDTLPPEVKERMSDVPFTSQLNAYETQVEKLIH